MDHYEKFLTEEVRIAEEAKDHAQDPLIRMLFVGQIAAFKSALYCYSKFKASSGQENANDV